MNGKRIPLEPHDTLDELKAKRNKCRLPNEIQRFNVIILMKQKGISNFKAGQLLGVSREFAHYTLLLYNEHGTFGLKDKRCNNKRGDTFKNDAFLKHLEEVMNKECPYGGLWNGKKVQKWVKDNYGKHFVISTIYRWLWEIDFSWQSPRPKHKHSDKEKQEKFKKNNLPN